MAPPTISIHALLAESDTVTARIIDPTFGFLSTLSLRRATPTLCPSRGRNRNFYPRSPCGERRGKKSSGAAVFPISIHALLAESDTSRMPLPAATRNFYPRSPCGERQRQGCHCPQQRAFLSTLSLRRATFNGDHGHISGDISIHALLAESDAG